MPIKSELNAGEVERRIRERLPGLLQKIFRRDPETGDICGIYFFEDEPSLECYRASDGGRIDPSRLRSLRRAARSV